MSEQVIIALISSIGGIIVSYITYVLAKKREESKKSRSPKDRMEQMFDGYERLIRQKDKEDERKVRMLNELEEELAITRKLVSKLEESLAITQEELKKSVAENKRLRDDLDIIRKEYMKNTVEENQENVYNDMEYN